MNKLLYETIEKSKPVFWALSEKISTNMKKAKTRFVQDMVWTLRHRKVFSNPEYVKPVPSEILQEHVSLWKQLRKRVKSDTLRVCYNISGEAFPGIVPEEIFAVEIEPALNRHAQMEFLSNKAIYEKWFGYGIFPICWFLRLDGQFYKKELKPLTLVDVENIIQNIRFPVVFKPCMYSSGGQNVFFPNNAQELLEKVEKFDNFVVQEKINQHPFFDNLNPGCLNTQRVCTYRSVKDNKVHVLNVAQRIGRKGTLDNATDGGIVRYVNEKGVLNNYAVDKYGKKFFKHPDYQKPFENNEIIPDFDRLKDLAISVTAMLPFVRLASLDTCMDESGKWRVVEINLFSQTIRFSQYGGRPFFGRFTQEVIEYCKNNPYQWK